jgi:hypothetical protein
LLFVSKSVYEGQPLTLFTLAGNGKAAVRPFMGNANKSDLPHDIAMKNTFVDRLKIIL